MQNPPPILRDSAGVRFPPPLLLVVPFLVGLSFDRHLTAWRPPALFATLAGGLLLLGAISLFLASVSLFRGRRTTLRTDRTSNTLVTDGPFRLSRNPIYTAMILLYLGLALTLRLPGALAALPIGIALLQIIVIRREERYLTRHFGDQYIAYRNRVRRWL